uniref:NAC domain protein n=1 Tax=Solanum tuberosum TaxID=4113 RepID=M1BQC8_SOLTU
MCLLQLVEICHFLHEASYSNVLFPCLVQDSMVVCRLRKNNEFHLNDTPGNQRNHLAVTNDTVDLSRAVQLNGLRGLIDGAECCSKEASSSFSSHSVEQIESGSESDKLNKELPQHHSSSYWKDCDEEDCFADIMKDDIIKLDDSSYKARHNLLPTITRKLESSTKSPTSQEAQNLMSNRLPFQGTANRRLKLQTENVPRGVERSEPHEAIKKNIHARGISRQLINIIPVKRMKQWPIPLLLVSLMLLVVFLCLFGVPQQVKWHYSS